MADMVPAVCRVLDQIEARGWDELERLPPAPPAWHELRGGQATRWIDCPG
jgi:hypothetical protein